MYDVYHKRNLFITNSIPSNNKSAKRKRNRIFLEETRRLITEDIHSTRFYKYVLVYNILSFFTLGLLKKETELVCLC